MTDYRKCTGLPSAGMMVITGVTGTGKTELVRRMVLDSYKRYHDCHLFCSTALEQPESYEWLPSSKKTTEVDEDTLITFVEKHKKRNRGKEESKRYRMLLILDDVIGDVNMKNSKFIDGMASKCRHWGLMVVILTQNLKHVSPTIRNNSSRIYVTKLHEHDLKTLHTIAGGGSIGDFMKYMKRACVDYQVILFDLKAGYGQSRMCFKFPRAERFRVEVPWATV